MPSMQAELSPRRPMRRRQRMRGSPSQGAVEAPDQDIDIVALVEGRHDNAQFRPFLTGQIGRAGHSRLAGLARIGNRGHWYSPGERTGVPPGCQGRPVDVAFIGKIVIPGAERSEAARNP
jgi:hypothetical protein